MLVWRRVVVRRVAWRVGWVYHRIACLRYAFDKLALLLLSCRRLCSLVLSVSGSPVMYFPASYYLLVVWVRAASPSGTLLPRIVSMVTAFE